MNAHAKAMAALAQTPEEQEKERERMIKADASERRRREEKDQADRYCRLAVAKIKEVLEIDASDWKVLNSTSSLAVFDDPEDGSIGGVKLSVTGGSYKSSDKMVIHYQPYSNWVGPPEGHSGSKPEWVSGPVVESLIQLARAIRVQEAHDRAVSASMPDHLP